jgi:hypothetical protein
VKASTFLASGTARVTAALIWFTASVNVAVGAVHAVANCSGAPPMLLVLTQLNVAGHRRRRPRASSPVGSLSGIVAANARPGSEADEHPAAARNSPPSAARRESRRASSRAASETTSLEEEADEARAVARAARPARPARPRPRVGARPPRETVAHARIPCAAAVMTSSA